MNRKFVSITLMVILILTFMTVSLDAAAQGGIILYVKPGASGNCTSWADACELQTALGKAVSGDEIWVAAGTYKPTTGTNQQLMPFSGRCDGTPDPNYMCDPNTILEFLDLTETMGRTYTDISGELGEGGEFQDFRYATEAEIRQLFKHAGIENVGPFFYPENWAPVTALIDLVGETSNFSVYSVGAGFTAEPAGGTTRQIAVLQAEISTQRAAAYFSNTVPEATSYGHWLVMRATRSATFQLKNGVALYGGFAGTEASRDQRDWQNNITVLSGDIGTAGDNSDNSYHVVSGNGVDGTVVLDGFTITAGQADGNGSQNNGGGMYNTSNSNPTLANVTFISNTANQFGGGMYNENSNPSLSNVNFSDNSAGQGGGIYNLTSSPMLVDATFIHNHAGFSGGGMVNATNSSPMLVNTRFISNTSDNQGGGMWNWNMEFSSNTLGPTLVNAVFIRNTAINEGGGLRNQHANTTLINVTFSGNSANSAGGGLFNEYLTLKVNNSILWNNSSANGSQVYIKGTSATTLLSYNLIQDGCPAGSTCNHVIDADPQFVDPNGPDNTAGTLDDNLHLQPSSPAINAGDNSTVTVTTDLDGQPRIQGGTVDMGAYETAVILFEDFDDNALDTSLWQETITGNGPVVAEKNQSLEISLPAGSSGNVFWAGYQSLFRLRGDYDIEVEYSLLIWPPQSGVRVGLRPLLNTNPVSVERTGFGTSDRGNGEVYLTNFGDGIQGITTTSDSTGKLRVVRSGNILTGYFFDAGSNDWVAMHSASTSNVDVSITLIAWSHDFAFGDQDVLVAFDNFIVHQGQVVMPPPSLPPLIEVPIRWCAIGIDDDSDGFIDRGPPSVINVENSIINDVLQQRLERLNNNIYIPRANMTFRSGATTAVPDFPIIPDPDETKGNYGDVVHDPENNDTSEFSEVINACRTAWENQDPSATGPIAVHINRFVDPLGIPTGIKGLGATKIISNGASQIAAGNVIVVDNIYTLGDNRVFCQDDVNDELLGHELGHALTLLHGDGVDQDNDGQLDEPGESTNPGEDGDEPCCGSNLMQYQKVPPGAQVAPLGIDLTTAQIDRIRDQAPLYFPDQETPPQLADSVDTLGDAPNGEDIIDIDTFGVTVSGTLTTFNWSIIADMWAHEVDLNYFFLVDSDNDPATGGLPGNVGVTTGGFELVGQVQVDVTSGTVTVSPTVSVFQNGSFVVVTDPSIQAEVLEEEVHADVACSGDSVDVQTRSNIQLNLSNAVRGVFNDTFRVVAVAQDQESIDEAEASLSFAPPTFPSCQVIPSLAGPGDLVIVDAIDLPPGSVHVSLGPDLVATGTADPSGNASIPFTIPEDADAGNRLVTVGAGDTAITADCTVFVTNLPVSNEPPIADANGPYGGDEGSTITLDASGSSDPDDNITLYEWDLDNDGEFGDDTGTTTNVTFGDNGVFTIGLRVTDEFGESDSDTAKVTVYNVAPSATFNAPANVDEGSDIHLSLDNPYDPSSADMAAGFEYAFDCGDGGGYNAFGSDNSAGCPTTDNGTRAVKGQIRDKDGGVTEYAASVIVKNVAPNLGVVTASPADPVVEVGTSVSFSATFTDPVGIEDQPYTCSFDWNGDNPDVESISTTYGSCNGTFTYPSAGVYTVKLTVADKDDGASNESVFEFVVVYDPSAGFVTGGGWIDSLPGAYRPDPTLAGQATFGFVSKYKKGASIPTGNTEFQFRAADLNFHSSSYDWLVVTGSDYARFKGKGTINGQGEYKFMLWAGDNDPDTLRIRIWTEDEFGVETDIYDNGFDQAIGGGSIVIHAKN